MLFESFGSWSRYFGFFSKNVQSSIAGVLINIHFLQLVFNGIDNTIYTTCCVDTSAKLNKAFQSLTIISMISPSFFLHSLRTRLNIDVIILSSFVIYEP